jgi:hypothetical protein
MALQRFVETYSFDSDTYNKIVESHKITESEIASIKGQRLSESTKRLLEDNSVLAEKTVWRFPVARYDNINLNNRKYEKRLWDRVIKEQQDIYKGGAGLKKHPDNDKDGEIEEQVVVWLNMGLNEAEKIVWAECVLVGDEGRHIEEILECGGRCGFSSSGFGELDESDHSTVRWDSYMLERVADTVLNPSQKVYGNSTMKIKKETVELPKGEHTAAPEQVEYDKDAMNNNKNDFPPEYLGKKQESTMPEAKIKQPISKNDAEDDRTDAIARDHMNKYGDKKICDKCHKYIIDGKCECKKQESMMPEVRMSARELRKFSEDVLGWMEKVPQDDLQEKLNELEAIRSYFSPGVHPDLLATVESQIAETQKAIDDAVKEHTKISTTFGVKKVEELKEGIKNLAVDVKLYERDAADWREIAEGLQEKNKMLMSVISSRPTAETYKEMLIQMKAIKDESVQKEASFAEYAESLKAKIVEHQKYEETIISELEKMNDENTKIKEYSGKLKEYGLKMRERVLQYRKEQKRYDEEIQSAAIEESTVRFRPNGHAVDNFAGFNESDDVQDYYEDLEMRYGKDVADFKEEIIGCKTLKEAMIKFNKIFASIGAKKTQRVSEALDPEERRKIIESTSGVQIKKHSNFENRLPPGWL